MSDDRADRLSPDLTALALEQLSDDERRAVQSRIDGDAELANELDRARRLGQLVRDAAGEPAVSNAPTDELVAAIDHEFASTIKREETVKKTDDKSRSQLTRRRLRLAALAATLLLAAGIWYVSRPWIGHGIALREGARKATQTAPANGALLNGVEPKSENDSAQQRPIYETQDKVYFGVSPNVILQPDDSSPGVPIAKDGSKEVADQGTGASGQSAAKQGKSGEVDITFGGLTATPDLNVPLARNSLGTSLQGDFAAQGSTGQAPQQELARMPANSPAIAPDGGTVLLGGIKSRDTSGESGENALDYRFDDAGDEGRYASRSAEQYELPPENAFRQPLGEHALTTFSVDVDTASYANIRRFINDGHLPPPAAVRIEEMINYFSWDYATPEDGRPFAVHLESAVCPWQPAHRLLRVGIKGREIPRDDRPPSNLVFLIDVSGSMADDNKLPLLKRSMLLLVDQLTENDRVSIVTYASQAGVRLEPVSGDQKQTIRDVINGLSAGGSTHGSAGIQTAYDLAARHFIAEGTNRVLLATDGDLNVGVTDDNQLVQLIKTQASRGVFLSVLGFGTGNLKDAKLEKIADNGNGHYRYIDSIREAQKVLGAELSGTLLTIARDVKLQIEFNPAEVAAFRLIGYENRALRNEDFANDRVDAGDIGAGHTVTALYELVPAGAAPITAAAAEPRLRYQTLSASVEPVRAAIDDSLTDEARNGELMMLSLRFKRPDSDVSELMEVPYTDNGPSFEQATGDFRFAAAVAAFGMKLRRSQFAGNWQLSDIENCAVSALGDDPQGHRAELVDLVRRVSGR